jgi:hypothetical protein
MGIGCAAAGGFSAVTAMQVASSGAVVSGTDDGAVRLWDLAEASSASSAGSTGTAISGTGHPSGGHAPTAVFRGHAGKITKIVLETAGPGRALGGGGGGSSGGGSSGGEWTGRFVTAGADHSVSVGHRHYSRGDILYIYSAYKQCSGLCCGYGISDGVCMKCIHIV